MTALRTGCARAGAELQYRALYICGRPPRWPARMYPKAPAGHWTPRYSKLVLARLEATPATVVRLFQRTPSKAAADPDVQCKRSIRANAKHDESNALAIQGRPNFVERSWPAKSAPRSVNCCRNSWHLPASAKSKAASSLPARTLSGDSPRCSSNGALCRPSCAWCDGET